MSEKKKPGKGGPPTGGFCTEYTDPRTGKLMRASDYGHKAWPFGGKRKQPPKPKK